MTRQEYDARVRAMDGARLVEPDPPGLTVGVILYLVAACLAAYAVIILTVWTLVENA